LRVGEDPPRIQESSPRRENEKETAVTGGKRGARQYMLKGVDRGGSSPDTEEKLLVYQSPPPQGEAVHHGRKGHKPFREEKVTHALRGSGENL